MTKADDKIIAGLCISQVPKYNPERKIYGSAVADHCQLGFGKEGGVVVTYRNTRPYSRTLYSRFRGSSMGAYCG